MAIVFQDYSPGDELSASDLQTFVMDQVVLRFSTQAARTTALSGYLAEGMCSYVEADERVSIYDGSNWVQLGTENDAAVVDDRSILIRFYT